MESAVFLALVVLLQVISMHCILGEIDGMIKERRMEVYRKRLVKSLSKIIVTKIPLASGIELGRALDTQTCGNCFLSDKVTTDSKCIKSCTRIIRFSTVSPTNPEASECDTCVATAVNRPNRVCDDTCTVRHLTTIMADVVNEAISFRERALLEASVEHRGDYEPDDDEELTNADREPADMWFRSRKADRASKNFEVLSRKNDRRDISNEPENKSGAPNYLSVFRVNPAKADDITDVSGKIEESFLNGNEGTSRSSIVHPKGKSDRIVQTKGRSGSKPGSSHQLLNNSERYNNYRKFKKNIETNDLFHYDNDIVSERDLNTDVGGSDISNYDGLEDLNADQASKSGGGFNLRDILSESVDDLNHRQQERIINSLKKLGNPQQSSRGSVDFNQRSKFNGFGNDMGSSEISNDDTLEDLNDDQARRSGSDFNLRDILSESVADLNHQQQERITNSLKKLGNPQQSSRGSVDFNQRSKFNGFGNDIGSSEISKDESLEDLNDDQASRSSGGFNLRDILSESVADLNHKQQARITNSLKKLGDPQQSSRDSVDFNQRSKFNSFGNDNGSSKISNYDSLEDLNDNQASRSGGDFNLRDILSENVADLDHRQQRRITNSLTKLVDHQQTSRGSVDFNQRSKYNGFGNNVGSSGISNYDSLEDLNDNQASRSGGDFNLRDILSENVADFDHKQQRRITNSLTKLVDHQQTSRGSVDFNQRSKFNGFGNDMGSSEISKDESLEDLNDDQARRSGGDFNLRDILSESVADLNHRQQERITNSLKKLGNPQQSSRGSVDFNQRSKFNGFGNDIGSSEISKDESLEDLNDDQASRSGGGFNLRDILSESVADLNHKQQARITNSLKKLGDPQQSSRDSVDFNQRSKFNSFGNDNGSSKISNYDSLEDLNDNQASRSGGDFNLRDILSENVADLDHRQQRRITNSLTKLVDQQQTSRGSVDFNQRSKYNGFGNNVGSSGISNYDSLEDLNDNQASRSGGDFNLRDILSENVADFDHKQQRRITNSLTKLVDHQQTSRGSVDFNQRSKFNGFGNDMGSSEISKDESLEDLNDDQARRSGGDFNLRDILSESVADLNHRQQERITNSLKKLGNPQQSSRGSVDFNQRSKFNGFGNDIGSSEISKDESLEDLNDDQASRSGGGFNLRDILSESVADLNHKQQARITNSLKKLGDPQQSSRDSVDFNQRSKFNSFGNDNGSSKISNYDSLEDLNDNQASRSGGDFNLRDILSENVADLDHRQQRRITNSLTKLVDQQQTSRGSVDFNQRSKYNGFGNNVGSSGISNYDGLEDLNDNQASRSGGDFNLRDILSENVADLDHMQQRRITNSLTKLVDHQQTSRGSVDFNQRSKHNGFGNDVVSSGISDYDGLEDLSDNQASRSGGDFNLRDILSEIVVDLDHRQQRRITNSLTKLGEPQQTNRGSVDFNQHANVDFDYNQRARELDDVKDSGHSQQKRISDAFKGILSNYPNDAPGGIHVTQEGKPSDLRFNARSDNSRTLGKDDDYNNNFDYGDGQLKRYTFQKPISWTIVKGSNISPPRWRRVNEDDLHAYVYEDDRWQDYGAL